MVMHVYTALRTESPVPELCGHITTSFTLIAGKMPKIDTVHPIYSDEHTAIVTEVVYWEQAKVTVALVDSPAAMRAFSVHKERGLQYSYEYRPHITMAYGEDKTAELRHLVGGIIKVRPEYVGFVDVKPKVTGSGVWVELHRLQRGDKVAIYHAPESVFPTKYTVFLTSEGGDSVFLKHPKGGALIELTKELVLKYPLERSINLVDSVNIFYLGSGG